MSFVFTIIGAILVILGLVFFIGAAFGLLRFPDFYTRMHAAGKGDTLCSLLIVLGVAVGLLAEVDWTHFDWHHTVPQLLVPLKRPLTVWTPTERPVVTQVAVPAASRGTAAQTPLSTR